MVVEDNAILRNATIDLLTTWGITPALAADGGEAVLLAAGGAYDIILMDLEMPGLSAPEATRLIRKEERDGLRAEPIPIVAYTNDACADEAWLRFCGFNAILSKPCDVQTMEACLTEFFPKSFCSIANVS